MKQVTGPTINRCLFMGSTFGNTLYVQEERENIATAAPCLRLCVFVCASNLNLRSENYNRINLKQTHVDKYVSVFIHPHKSLDTLMTLWGPNRLFVPES